MSVKIVIKPNTYFDSVSLMSISTRANKLDGVEQAFVAIAPRSYRSRISPTMRSEADTPKSAEISSSSSSSNVAALCALTPVKIEPIVRATRVVVFSNPRFP